MHDLRKQYTRDGLNDAAMLADPIDQLQVWFNDALTAVSVDWFEPNAATLATAGADGRVTARIVLLKGLDQHGLLFYTNYESPKGRQLAENPHAAIVIYWPHLERQVRIEGTVSQVPREMSESYFHSRPRGSQIGAAISSQSSVVPGREYLESAAAALEQRLQGGDVPLPDHWGGYRLHPTVCEFWQGRTNRLHDRIRYRRTDTQWVRERLAP